MQACGICHSDSFTKLGAFPGIQFPRVPGHEVVGRIDAVGADVPEWKPGARVGVGWHGGHCGHCHSCRRGDFITCTTGQVPGISYDGGYADYLIAPFEALASIPEGLSSVEAPPLLMVGGRRSIVGWPSGTSSDSEDTLDFSVMANVRPMIETFPLQRASEAYERMMSGKARFRVVLDMESVSQ